MKFAIALFDPPHSPAARRALCLSETMLAGGYEIVRLFFYQDGVHSASANVVNGQDGLGLPAAWRGLVECNGLDAIVCIAATLRRDVLGVEEAKRYGRSGADLGAP